MAKKIEVANLTLNNGVTMPMVGLGTFQGTYDYKSQYDVVYAVVHEAISVGYRHIDTAFIYDTENAVGDAINDKIKDGSVKREDMFVTTKLWNNYHKRKDVPKGLQKSLDALKLDYVDLLLVHWPIAFKPGEEPFPKDEQDNLIYADNEIDYLETWQGMEDVLKTGKVKAIGVSNFNVKQMTRLLENCNVKPAVFQMENYPFFANVELVELCHKNSVSVVAFSPLGKPARPWKKETDPSIFTDTTIVGIAEKYKKTPAQVALRYQIQRNIGVVPKTKTSTRLVENLDVFDFVLNEEEMNQIKSMNADFRVLWLDYLRGSKEYPFC